MSTCPDRNIINKVRNTIIGIKLRTVEENSKENKELVSLGNKGEIH